jgi:hypothetical protein
MFLLSALCSALPYDEEYEFFTLAHSAFVEEGATGTTCYEYSSRQGQSAIGEEGEHTAGSGVWQRPSVTAMRTFPFPLWFVHSLLVRRFRRQQHLL